MTPQQMLTAALKCHRECPGAWVQTNRHMTAITDVIRDPKRERPTDGQIWWRTHNLVRTLGGQA